MRFRNIDFDTNAPLDQWPAEAIETVIARGSLSDWSRLVSAIHLNPWGPAARTTETVTSWGENYGVDALMANVIHSARKELTLRGRAQYAAQIRSWRSRAGMTLRELARAAGTSPSRLSDYENAKVAPTTDVLARLRHVSKGRSAVDGRPRSAVDGRPRSAAEGRARSAAEGPPDPRAADA